MEVLELELLSALVRIALLGLVNLTPTAPLSESPPRTPPSTPQGFLF